LKIDDADDDQVSLIGHCDTFLRKEVRQSYTLVVNLDEWVTLGFSYNSISRKGFFSQKCY